jgi:hypothetical protein
MSTDVAVYDSDYLASRHYLAQQVIKDDLDQQQQQQPDELNSKLSDSLQIGKILLAIEFLWILFWASITPYIITKDVKSEEHTKIYLVEHILYGFHISTMLVIALIIEHYRDHTASKKIGNSHESIRVGYLASWAIGLIAGAVTDITSVAYFIRESRFVPDTMEFRLEFAIGIWAAIDTGLIIMWSAWLCSIHIERRLRAAHKNRLSD